MKLLQAINTFLPNHNIPRKQSRTLNVSITERGWVPEHLRTRWARAFKTSV